MWPPCTKLGYFKFIWYVSTQFDQHFPDHFVQNILAMFSQYTKLGKLKTHGKYIASIGSKFSIFWVHHNILTMCFQFPKLGILWKHCKYILNKVIRKMLVELGWHIPNELEISQFGTWWSHDLGYCKEYSKYPWQLLIWNIVVTWPGISWISWQYPKLGHGNYICLVYFEYAIHVLAWYMINSLAPELTIYLQCTVSVHHPLPPVSWPSTPPGEFCRSGTNEPRGRPCW